MQGAPAWRVRHQDVSFYSVPVEQCLPVSRATSALLARPRRRRLGTGTVRGPPFWLGSLRRGGRARADDAGRADRRRRLSVGARRAPYLDVAAADPRAWGRTAGARQARRRPRQRGAVEQLAVLQRLDLRGAERLAEPVPADVTPASHLNCSGRRPTPVPRIRPNRTAKQRRVWQIAADGWLDQVWRSKLLHLQEELLRQVQPAQHPHRPARRARAQHHDQVGQTAPTGAATA